MLFVKTNSFALALRSSGRGGRLYFAGLVTIPIWISFFGFYMLLGRAMGLPEHVRFAEATFGASLASMFNLLPLNGAAGLGTQELGWVAGFSQFLGVHADVALASGMGVHLVQLFNIVVFGLVAHLVMGLVPAVVLRSSDNG